MDNVQSNYNNIQTSEKDLLNHYDLYGAILRKTYAIKYPISNL